MAFIPQKKDRTGEKMLQRCGQWCQIINYRRYSDIDVLFEDGTIIQNKKYEHFLDGRIANPNAINKHVGETHTMNDGGVATIIAWNNSRSLTVKFSNGLIRENIRYDELKNGCISSTPKTMLKQSRIGETRKMNNGMFATIIEYENSSNLTVKFEDETTRKHIKYYCFKHGKVAYNPVKTETKNDRLLKKKMMRNGMVATIVQYKNCQDIIVEFEDGVSVKTEYCYFKRGVVAHPNALPKHQMSLQEFAIAYYMNRYGFKKMPQGELYDLGFGNRELDLYNEDKRVAIEYDGEIHDKFCYDRDLEKNKLCKQLNITLYRLRDPRIKKHPDGAYNIILKKECNIVGGLIDCKKELEMILTHCGIKYDPNDIDFVRDLNELLKKYNKRYVNYNQQYYFGKTQYNTRENQNMKIIAYRAWNDIDVMFDDGEIRTSVRYEDFKKGCIAKKARSKKYQRELRLNEIRTMKNGKQAKIIAYRQYKDIDVLFIDDNKIVTKCSYGHFKNGDIRCP